jgi:heavy metal sensor kinase
MNTRSIGFRLVAWYAGLLALVFLLLAGVMRVALKSYLEQSLGNTQLRRARQIAETLLAHIDQTGEARVISEIDSWFAPEGYERFIRITRGDGRTLYVSHNPRGREFDAAQAPAFRGEAAPGVWREVTTPDGRALMIGALPCASGSGERFLVEVGAPLEPVRAVLRRFVVLLGFTLAAMLAAATGGGCFLVRKALAPVDKIARSAERITLRNLKERLPLTPTGDEMERLSVSLNRMIARLEDAFQHNHRFMADASHELRTPLTIIRGELESIMEHPAPAAETREMAASILEEVERLARIVEGLFAISRLDAGEAQSERVPFDLAKLAAGTAGQMCLLAEDKGITLTCDTPEVVGVEGDRSRLKQVVVNLLDNAIKYTPGGGKVKLSVRAVDGKAVLEVEDNGIGIPAEARPLIFERFFRVDKARSRDLGGAGLGLSIVKSICAAHGGGVEVQSVEGAGSRFKIELPLSRALDGQDPARDPFANAEARAAD